MLTSGTDMKCHSEGEHRGISLSVAEAEILASCIVETDEALDSWEYEIRIGVPRDEVLEILSRLKACIRSLRGEQ